MIPDQMLSSTPVPGDFIERVNRPLAPLIDYERGGAAVGDAGAGRFLQEWKAEVIGADVWLSAESVAPFVYLTRPGITLVSLAFDQNMIPYVAFVDGSGAWLYWFDTSAGGMVTTSIPGARTPRLCTDDKRMIEVANSDVILAYMVGTELRYRQQRDRFQTEIMLATGLNADLVAVAMADVGRLQFQLVTA